VRTHVPFCLPKDLVLQAERTQPLPIVSTRCIRHDASDQLGKPQPYQQMPSAATKMHLEIHSFRTFVRGSACQTALPFDTIHLPRRNDLYDSRLGVLFSPKCADHCAHASPMAAPSFQTVAAARLPLRVLQLGLAPKAADARCRPRERDCHTVVKSEVLGWWSMVFSSDGMSKCHESVHQ
jgi:hypothetical protein